MQSHGILDDVIKRTYIYVTWDLSAPLVFHFGICDKSESINDSLLSKMEPLLSTLFIGHGKVSVMELFCNANISLLSAHGDTQLLRYR